MKKVDALVRVAFTSHVKKLDALVRVAFTIAWRPYVYANMQLFNSERREVNHEICQAN